MARLEGILGRSLARLRREPRLPILELALISVLVVTTVIALRGAVGPGSGSGPTAVIPPATAPLPSTPAGTGVVARLPFSAFSSFSWAPDGAHLLVSDASASRVYDRFGKLVSQFGGPEGWLDAGHVVGGDGSVSPLDRPGSSGSGGAGAGGNSAVVANGAGAAAIVVARPGCVGDPIVDWYRDGHFTQTNEHVTPFGWSPDGKLALFGHMACGSTDAEAHGWKGSVSVVDFASGKVLATVPGVRGEMAFSPDQGMLAAQSDSDLELVDLEGAGDVQTMPGLRFLGWLDTESLYAASGDQIEFVDLDPTDVTPAPGGEWQAESPTGLHIAADLTGAARRIVASDGTTLLDLTSAGLIAERYPSPGSPVISALQASWWSPDGRMLVLESAAGDSLVLLSVDPGKPGSL